MISGMIHQTIMNLHGNTKITNNHMQQVNITLDVLMSDNQGHWLATTPAYDKLFTNNEAVIREALEKDTHSLDPESQLLGSIVLDLVNTLGVIEI
jgi:hypothetical protein